jgi:hypothetical protein
MEHETQKQILDFLSYQKDCYSWRNNTGAVKANYNGVDRYIRFSEKGSADIFFILKGKFYACECKSKGKKQSDDQRRWQEKIVKVGAVYILTDDYFEFQDWFNKLIEQKC